jgi:hypothetical protein
VGISPETDRTYLVRNPGKWDALADEQVPSEHALVALVTVDLALALVLH